MKEFFTRLVKKYFHFQRQDRNGMLLLVALIVVVLLGHVVVDHWKVRPSGDISAFEEALNRWEDESAKREAPRTWFKFDPNTVSEKRLESLDISPFIKNNLMRYRDAGGRFSEPADVRKIYGMNDSIFALMEPFLQFSGDSTGSDDHLSRSPITPSGTFDPNTAGEETLFRFGFNRFQASNLIGYRTAGGYFSRPGDLIKIYGIDSAFLQAIEKCIRIEKRPEGRMQRQKIADPPVELNSADSLQLVRLRGIGPVFAVRILKYRALLGGYYTPRQLLEVYGFPRETFLDLQENFRADTTKIKKMRINFAGYTEMIRHPYLESEVVEAVLEYREQNGPFLSTRQLLTAGLTDSVVYVMVEPYFSCR